MEDEQIVSHNDNVQENPLQEQIDGAMKMFGLDNEVEQEQEITQAEQDADDNDPPAIEETKNVRKVKFNKQEVEVEEAKVDELLQKGLALDKERERKSEYEKALQRAAKLAGFDSHDEYMKSLDKLEEQAKQREQEQFKELKQQLLDDAVDANLDPEKLEKYLDSHPLFKQAQEAISKAENVDKQSRLAQERVNVEKQWEDLFTKHPDLAKEEDAGWLTPEMDARLKRGLLPIEAYELTHKDRILSDERKKMEQSLIKQQRLNKRAKVEGNVTPEQDDGVPNNVKGAFAAFGLDPNSAKKFMTKK